MPICYDVIRAGAGGGTRAQCLAPSGKRILLSQEGSIRTR